MKPQRLNEFRRATYDTVPPGASLTIITFAPSVWRKLLKGEDKKRHIEYASPQKVYHSRNGFKIDEGRAVIVDHIDDRYGNMMLEVDWFYESYTTYKYVSLHIPGYVDTLRKEFLKSIPKDKQAFVVTEGFDHGAPRVLRWSKVKWEVNTRPANKTKCWTVDEVLKRESEPVKFLAGTDLVIYEYDINRLERVTVKDSDRFRDMLNFVDDVAAVQFPIVLKYTDREVDASRERAAHFESVNYDKFKRLDFQVTRELVEQEVKAKAKTIPEDEDLDGCEDCASGDDCGCDMEVHQALMAQVQAMVAKFNGMVIQHAAGSRKYEGGAFALAGRELIDAMAKAGLCKDTLVDQLNARLVLGDVNG
ncbi:hypothetical protein [Burkholderia phage BCSR5]|nr:hypothetical protein [Burkholderia phage BCSR5]